MRDDLVEGGQLVGGTIEAAIACGSLELVGVVLVDASVAVESLLELLDAVFDAVELLAAAEL
ncbi:hypothetical protein GXW82_05175 [Streptacidiphilus sp. 4-A2]|nr:hypothetical protein [Streptacidiphilus sp. 4-A2]